MTRPLYAPEPQGVRSAPSSAFEWDNPKYEAARRAQKLLALDERDQYERARDRAVELRDRKIITETEKIEKLRRIASKQRRDEERAKSARRRGGAP